MPSTSLHAKHLLEQLVAGLLQTLAVLLAILKHMLRGLHLWFYCCLLLFHRYDPNGVKALDYVLDSAARHNITLILSFIDNWKYYNGIGQVSQLICLELCKHVHADD
jgi:hypothetical protein